MNMKDFDAVVESTIQELRMTLMAKGKEYTKTTDRLKNFKDAADMNGCSPEQALWGFVSKHIIALKDFISSPAGVLDNQWKEKTGDIINYMILLRALLEEKKKLAERKWMLGREASGTFEFYSDSITGWTRDIKSAKLYDQECKKYKVLDKNQFWMEYPV